MLTISIKACSIKAGAIKAGLLLSAMLMLPLAAQPTRLIVATNSEYTGSSVQDADNAVAQYLSNYASRVEPIGGALRKRGGSGLLRLELASGVQLQQAVNYYRQLPGVRFVEPDYLVKKQQIPNDPQFNLQWHLSQAEGINAPAFWQQSSGEQQLVVAVVDTGVAYNHPDLQANLWRNPLETVNGADDDGNGYIDDIYGIDTANNTSDPTDQDGHGSQIGGIIAATTNNTLGVAGVNWQLQVLHCKFLDETGTGFVSDAIACLD
ncbi:S8 family serine peptidase, partial [Arsukibacterium sp.]|uniref:S8 family serine peptidase n=1 Tax=Arsukibacterium sp. TaxID=1977258 RepID=UPI00356B0411